jgi:hypothetical protein
MTQKEKMRDLIAQLIPILLLGIYVFAIGAAIWSTIQAIQLCDTNALCAQNFHARRIEGVNFILNVVGGLVSALVIAELAITQPGDWPSAQILRRGVPKPSKNIVKIVSTGFVIVWLVGGTASLVMYVLYPNAIPAALSEFAKAWLGLAIASAYSYLGIR